jgi:hypothetical protein
MDIKVKQYSYSGPTLTAAKGYHYASMDDITVNIRLTSDLGVLSAELPDEASVHAFISEITNALVLAKMDLADSKAKKIAADAEAAKENANANS